MSKLEEHIVPIFLMLIIFGLVNLLYWQRVKWERRVASARLLEELKCYASKLPGGSNGK